MSNDTLPLWFNSLEMITSYTFMFASFVTLPLYWIEIIVLITLRKSLFHGMFYRIFTIGITIDMISFLNNYFGCVFPAKGWFMDFYLSQGTSVGQIYLIIAWTSRGIQGCTVVSLALNRATAVCIPMKHKRIWSSKYAWSIHLFQVGIGLCIGSALVLQKFHWKFENEGIYIQFDDLKFRSVFFICAYIIESIFVVIIIIINITMLIYFKKKYRQRTVNSTLNSHFNQKVITEKQRQENNLTIVAILTCGAEIIYYVYVIYVFGINTNVPTRVFYLLYDVINDMYCGLSGWLLIIYSGSMRAHVLKYLHLPTKRFRTMLPVDNHVSSAAHRDKPIRVGSKLRVPTCETPC